MGGEREERAWLSGTASLLKEVLLRLAALWSRSLSLNPSFLIHCHSSAASRQNRHLHYQFSTHVTLSISRVVHHGRTCANLLPSCRASTPDRIHHAWLQPPTLLTRRGRQRDMSRAHRSVLVYVYVEMKTCTYP